MKCIVRHAIADECTSIALALQTMRTVRGNCTLTSAFLDSTRARLHFLQKCSRPLSVPNPGGNYITINPDKWGILRALSRGPRVVLALTLINIRRAVLMGTHRFVISAFELLVYALRIIMNGRSRVYENL